MKQYIIGALLKRFEEELVEFSISGKNRSPHKQLYIYIYIYIYMICDGCSPDDF